MAYIINAFIALWRHLRRQDEQADAVENQPLGQLNQRSVELHNRMVRRSMSPGSRVQRWNTDTSNASSDDSPLRNRGNRGNKRGRAPQEDGHRNTKKQKLSASAGADEALETTEHANEETNMQDVQEDTVITSTAQTPHTANASLAIQNERIRIVQEKIALGWDEQEIEVLERLHLRGLEPILPYSFEFDLKTVPLNLFTHDTGNAFLHALGRGNSYSTDGSATRALNKLMEAGSRIRSRMTTTLPVEVTTKKALEAYRDWTLRDAGLWKKKNYIPNLAIVTASKTMRADDILRKALRSVYRLEARWKKLILDTTGSVEESNNVPILHVITLSHQTMFFFTYLPGPATENPMSNLRSIAFYRWGNVAQDIWTSFAAAIFMSHCQFLLVTMLEEIGIDAGETVEEEDVDA